MLKQFAWRIVGATMVCCLFVYVMFQWLGAIGLVIAAPLIGVAFSRLVIDGSAEMGQAMRSAVWLPLHGKHYVYQGFNLKIIEDDDHARCVAMAGVRRIVGSGATDKALAQSYPSGWQVWDARGHLRDDALLLYLAREPSTAAIKLRNWVDHNVAFPARTARKRRGVYLREPHLPVL